MKKESIAEFLARGGVIKVVPPVTPESKVEPIRAQIGGPANFLTMTEHDMYHGEKSKAKTTTTKNELKIDFDSLPEVLKQKYLKMWEEMNDNEDESV